MSKWGTKVVALVMLGLLVAGSVFNVGWALTAVEIFYWITYPIGFVVIILCLGGALIENDHMDKFKEAFNQPLFMGTVRNAVTFALLVYAGLIALPVFVVLFYLTYIAFRYIVNYEDEE